MSLRITETGGFMQGGGMVPDPVTMFFGTSGFYRAQGGIQIPSNPNADHGFGWYQEIDDVTNVAQDTLWTTFTPNPQFDKYAGGRVPGIDSNGATDYAPDARNVTITLFQNTTVYVRVEGLVLRYFHKGSTYSKVNNCVGYAIRVDGQVDMGTLMGGFSGRTDYGYYRFFDNTRGYAIAGSGGVSDDKMRVPARRMNSNQTAVCAHVSTWEEGYDIGAPRIGHGNGGPTVESVMAFCCSSTHELTLAAGTHTIGIDVFCSANGDACATFNGASYSVVQSLKGGSMTVSTVNSWGDVGAGVITLTGTCYDRNCPYPYPNPTGTLFVHNADMNVIGPILLPDMVANSSGQITNIGNTDMSSQQTAMNRVCELLHGVGSEARDIGARSYNSPGNNTVFLYSTVGPLWTRVGARSYNSHWSGTFKCTDPNPSSIIYYYGPYRQGVNATVTYTAPTGYFYPVIGGDGCAGGGSNEPEILVRDPDGSGGCFKSGTMITMANGSLKPIELIEIGDEILGAMPYGVNQKSLLMDVKTSIVTAVQRPARFYKHISFNNGLVLATPEHLMLVVRDGSHMFEAAALIKIGDLLINIDGELVEVNTIEMVMDEDNYFNFSCDGHHTYIANGLVVHNLGNNITGYAPGGVPPPDTNNNPGPDGSWMKY